MQILPQHRHNCGPPHSHRQAYTTPSVRLNRVSSRTTVNSNFFISPSFSIRRLRSGNRCESVYLRCGISFSLILSSYGVLPVLLCFGAGAIAITKALGSNRTDGATAMVINIRVAAITGTAIRNAGCQIAHRDEESQHQQEFFHFPFSFPISIHCLWRTDNGVNQLRVLLLVTAPCSSPIQKMKSPSFRHSCRARPCKA